VAAVDDGPKLVEAIVEHRPDIAVVDVRLPPTFTDEGIRAALQARARFPGLGVLILSQYVEPVYTAELLDSDGDGGLGYLLKERVGDVKGFVSAVERVAAGRHWTARSSRAARGRDTGWTRARSREHEVLALMAEGERRHRSRAGRRRAPWRSNISVIFGKLDLSGTIDDDHLPCWRCSPSCASG
jgi:DNA-binding NarL/FixJ family response regulator